MRLKRVRLFGFKTFADRAEFDLDGGIVAVVGPNGCGKSNLVDAILWGLGEGNARTLRASNAADVIFNGAKSRRGVGYCEVSLLFDNEDGVLPIEGAEVELSRRLTRTGDSVYAINRRPCRLRDVVELLADSGLGRAGYAVVGQREIDAALAASAEERRGWLDAAAGVQRYRARKVEALKRLHAAREHLERVGDLIAELARQEGPMQKEAERASRARLIATELQGIEVGLLARELRIAKSDVRDAQERMSRANAEAERARDRAARAEVASLEFSAKAEVAEQQAALARRESLEATSARDAAEADLRVAAERAEGLRLLVGSYGPAREEAAAAVVTNEVEVARVMVAFDRLKVAIQEAEAAEPAVAEAVRQAEAARAVAESALARARAVVERLDRERVNQEAQAARKEGELALLADLSAELEQSQDLLVESEANVAETQAVHVQLQSVSEELGRERSESMSRLAAAENEVRSADRDLATLLTRAEALHASLEAAEGANAGARAVLDLIRTGKLDFQASLVGAAVSCAPEHALAIETALGGAAHDLIVERDADAQRAIRLLKEGRLGRATFQPLDLVRGSSALKRPQGSEIIGTASELVETGPAYRPLIDSLLGRVVVVRSLEGAIRLAREGGGWSKVVTLEGEVVSSRGAVTGGIAARAGAGLVQRTSELRTLEKRIEHATRVLADAKVEQERADHAVRSAGEAWEQAIGETRDAESKARQSAADRDALNRATSLLRTRIAALEERKAENPAISVEEIPDLAALEKVRDEALRAALAQSTLRREHAGRLAELRARAQESRETLGLAQQRLASAQDGVARLDARIADAAPERDRITALAEAARARRAEAEALLSEVNRRETEAEEARRLAQTHVLAKSSEAREVRAEISVFAEASHQADLFRARAEARAATALERLMEVYGLTESDALAQEEIHEIPPDAPQAVARLRRELKAMGEVSYGAIEAYDALADRLAHLRVQSQDIEDALVEIMGGIAELDELTRERFLTTFDQVAAAFREEFETMFGGGVGEIRLTDPQNILETGLDIDVQLPGKRRQPLPLLSGGERSLCAIAFLFALLRVRPSPLVVLDEVDAPLDGRNVERFASALVRLSQGLQFFVITHNPVTIEVAQTWLGVTMQEPGVSTLIPARLGTTKAQLMVTLT